MTFQEDDLVIFMKCKSAYGTWPIFLLYKFTPENMSMYTKIFIVTFPFVNKINIHQ